MNRAPLLAVGLLATTVLAGCTTHADGAPIPQTTSASQTGGVSTTTPQTSRLLPPRPRDIDVNGLDPCKALTVVQMKALKYDRGWQRPPEPGTNGVSGEPDCAYSSSQREFGSLITFVANAGAEVWLTDPGHKPDVPPQKTTVAGFPALQITVAPTAPRPDKCQIIVDVHDGQYIDVFSDRLVGNSTTGSAAYCTEAKKVAAMVIETAENG